MYKEAVFKLCKRVLEKEEYPKTFDCTILHQIYKGKGLRTELGNSHFIHLKHWLPRICENMVVDKWKVDVLSNSTKYQIGGQERHRTQEHLFSVRSVIALHIMREEGVVLQINNIRKFFDKENIFDVMDTLYTDGVEPSVYRAWFSLNENTRIKVLSGCGLTDEANVGAVVGQGTSGGALASQRNIDKGVNSYFSNSKDEINYGKVRFQPLSLQDDILRVAPNISSARVGNVKLNAMIQEKQLECHPDKTSFLIFGSKSYRENSEEELRGSPIVFGNFEVKEKVKDKYLGDWFHNGGLSQSVEATVSDRSGKIKGAIMEVAAVMEDMRMQVVGGLMGAWDLWNHALIPSLLNNCGTWTEMSSTTSIKLEELQNLFLRRMLRVPVSIPKAETGFLSMKHRIWAEKVSLAAAIRRMDVTSLPRQVMEEQVAYGWPGLVKEVFDICEEIMIPNVMEDDVPKRIIKEALIFHNCQEIRMEIETKKMKKLKDIKNEDFSETKQYMKKKSISESRTQFRIRTNMLELRGNMKGSHKNDLSCLGCKKQDTQEDQLHVMSCSAYEDLRIGLNFSEDGDLVTYFQKVMLAREKLK